MTISSVDTMESGNYGSKFSHFRTLSKGVLIHALERKVHRILELFFFLF